MNKMENHTSLFTELNDEDAASISGGGWWEDTKKQAQRLWNGTQNTRKAIEISFGLFTGRLFYLPFDENGNYIGDRRNQNRA